MDVGGGRAEGRQVAQDHLVRRGVGVEGADEILARARRAVKVFGADYPTPDGTAIRDYVHERKVPTIITQVPRAAWRAYTARLDPEVVRQLAELLNQNDLTEIEVEDGDRKIRGRRELTVAAAPAVMAMKLAVTSARRLSFMSRNPLKVALSKAQQRSVGPAAFRPMAECLAARQGQPR